jgi:hypothetical protein
MTHLTPVAAAEAHVRLVSTIEADTDSLARHPSGQVRSGQSWRHPGDHVTNHPAVAGSRRDLKPMPSAEPLPKPPVIVRRLRPATSVRPPTRGAGAIGTSTDTRSANGGWWNPNHDDHDDDRGPGPDPVMTFRPDDARYRLWIDAHPSAFVLNRTESRSRTPTLHRVGCAAVQPRPQSAAATRGVKVCGPSAEALRAWSAAQGSGRPAACRRCNP